MDYTLTAYFPNIFERDPNLALVNTSRSKPQQRRYEKINNCSLYGWFWQQVAKFFSSTFFSSTYATSRHRQAVV